MSPVGNLWIEFKIEQLSVIYNALLRIDQQNTLNLISFACHHSIKFSQSCSSYDLKTINSYDGRKMIFKRFIEFCKLFLLKVLNIVHVFYLLKQRKIILMWKCCILWAHIIQMQMLVLYLVGLAAVRVYCDNNWSNYFSSPGRSTVTSWTGGRKTMPGS